MNFTKCPKCGGATLDILLGECSNCGKISFDDWGWKLKWENNCYVLYHGDEVQASFPRKTEKAIGRIAKLSSSPIEVVDRYFTRMELEALKQRQQPTTNLPITPPVDKYDVPEYRADALTLLSDPAFFYKMALPLRKGFKVAGINKMRFAIGEEENIRFIPVRIIGSVYLKDTPITFFQGSAGTDKDGIVRMWLTILQDIKVIERTSLTAASMRYSQNLAGTELVYIADAPKIEGGKALEFRHLRTDDAGAKTEYAHKDPETEAMTTDFVEIRKYAIILTTNELPKDVPLQSGVWILKTDSSKELTKQVKEEILKGYEGKHDYASSREINVLQYAFHIMHTEELPEKPITIPYAGLLKSLLTNSRSESRRDPDKLCELIQTIAWMRRFQKPKEDRGEADVIDFVTALQIANNAIAETMVELNPLQRKILHILSTNRGVGFSSKDITEHFDVDQKTVYNRLNELVNAGYITRDKFGDWKYFFHPLTEFFESGIAFSPKTLKKLISDIIQRPLKSGQKPSDKFVDPISGKDYFIKLAQTYLPEEEPKEDNPTN